MALVPAPGCDAKDVPPLVKDDGHPPDAGDDDADDDTEDPNGGIQDTSTAEEDHPFVAVSAGGFHSCALTSGGGIRCWGAGTEDIPEDESESPHSRQGIPLSGRVYSQVTSGFRHTCAINHRDGADCWGHWSSGSPPARFFRQVGAGSGGRSCGVTMEDDIECWTFGDHDFDIPEGSFLQVEVGVHHYCALTTQEEMTCWGYGLASESPQDSFTRVSVGGYHSCALSFDGEVACWGAGLTSSNCDPTAEGARDCGQSIPPGGEFVDVAAGDLHSCAVTASSEVVCWGSDHEGQSSPPEGVFVQVSTGYRHSCAVTPDGDAVCWGNDEFGQSTAPPWEQMEGENP